jgi:hypothetical protein
VGLHFVETTYVVSYSDQHFPTIEPIRSVENVGMYYYDPKGHKTDFSGADWGAEGKRDTKVKRQHNIDLFLVTGAACPVPAPRSVRFHLALVTPRLGLGWSSCDSVGPKVARGWTVLFPGIRCSRRRGLSTFCKFLAIWKYTGSIRTGGPK